MIKTLKSNEWLIFKGIYGFLKISFNSRFMHARTFVSVAVCQAVDTILFTFLGLGALVANPWHVIIVSYSIKLIATVLAIVFIKLLFLFLPFYDIKHIKRGG